MRTRNIVLGVGFALSFAVLNTVAAHAAPMELLNWAPVPDTVGAPEIVYNGSLATGIGAIGNGDGQFLVTNQTAGGLQVDTVVTAPIPFSFPSSVFTGGTGYYDVTLIFTGLAAVGPAQVINFGAFSEDSQALGTGTFQLISTGDAGSVPLLTGTISGATLITGIDGGNSGATFNASGITYTGGVILGGLPAGLSLSGNDMSISMTSVIPGFSIDPGTGQLAPFSADATGQFDIKPSPEPASLALAAIGAAALITRRRR